MVLISYSLYLNEDELKQAGLKGLLINPE